MAFAGVELGLEPSTIAGSGMEVTMDAVLMKCLDRRAHQAAFVARLPDETTQEVLGQLRTRLDA